MHNYYADPAKHDTINLQAMMDDAQRRLDGVNPYFEKPEPSLIHIHAYGVPCKGKEHKYYGVTPDAVADA